MQNIQLWRQFENQIVNEQYVLNRAIGAGAEGCVFHGTNITNNNPVAIKIMIRDQDERTHERQQLEINTATELDHPNIVRCFESGECKINNFDVLYIVMELATETLEQRLANGVLSSEKAKELALSLAKALNYLQDSEINQVIVHRDLKPGNVLWVENRWKLSDFGVVKIMENRDRTDTRAFGTPFYAPPEAYKGEYSIKSDVWSLGIILAEALTGKRPFDGQTATALQKAVINDEPNLGNLPQEFNNIVKGCLIKNPQDRWKIQQVIKALSGQLGVLPTRSLETQEIPKEPRSIETQEIPVPQSAPPRINYDSLETYLRERRFKEADRETLAVINLAINKNPNQEFTTRDIDKIPWDVLHKIDQLWAQYSNNKFGFGEQMRIFQSITGNSDVEKFFQGAEHVGWAISNTRIPIIDIPMLNYYDDLTFNVSAPQGHLPVLIWSNLLGVNNSARITITEVLNIAAHGLPKIDSFFKKLGDCNITGQ